MSFDKFIHWAKQCGEKISLFHVIFISCLFALISIWNMRGGILHPEMDVRLPFYMSDTPLLNKIFDSDILDTSLYRARELSYLFDFVDSKFIQFCIENGLPHFLSLTHYIASIAIGCLLWLFCVRELKLHSLVGIGWLALFWTSPSIFLGGSFFRTGKIVVAFVAATLFYLIYSIAAVSIKEDGSRISKKPWVLYFISIFLITFLDEQGVFVALIALIFLTIWSFFARHKILYMMLFIGAVSIGLHGLYRFIIAPYLTFMLNGYWPDFSYVPTMPLQQFIGNVGSYISSGTFLYVETLRFLIGNPPLIVAYGLLVLFILMPFVYFYTTPGLSRDDKKYFIPALTGLLMTNIMLVVMNALMIFKKPDFISLPDIRVVYYFVTINVIVAMMLAMLTGILCKLRVPGWLVLMIICVAITGNIAAIPKHKSMMEQGHIKRSYEFSSSVLNALKQFDAPENFNALSVHNSNLLAFLKSRRNKISIDVQDYNKKGIDYAQRGQYRLAIKHFNHAIRRNPDDLQSYLYRGDLYLKLQHQQQAIEDCNTVLRLKPDLTLAYNNRGSAYINQGNSNMGCRDFQKACDLGDCLLWKVATNEGVCP